jgi:hypothetical protein
MQGRRALSVPAAVVVILAVGPLDVRSNATARGTGTQAVQVPVSLGSASGTDFLAQMHRALRTQHERMIGLATEIKGGKLDPDLPADLLVNQRIATRTANSEYQNAKLTREVAEIAVVEYSEGIFVQDKATAEQEVLLAQSDINQKQILLDGLKDRLARIQAASKGSAIDLSIEFRTADAIVDLERALPKARLELAKAETRRNTLVEFTRPIRLRELAAEVERARADELAMRAAFERAAASERRLAAAAAAVDDSPPRGAGLGSMLGRLMAGPPPREEDRVLAALAKAAPIEGALRSRLSQATKELTLDLPAQREIRDLVRQLEDAVDEAAGEKAAILLVHRKARIHRAAASPTREF